ncbi:hypothetical protein ACWXWB_22610, partial [Pantoea dispersa]
KAIDFNAKNDECIFLNCPKIVPTLNTCYHPAVTPLNQNEKNSPQSFYKRLIIIYYPHLKGDRLILTAVSI